MITNFSPWTLFVDVGLISILLLIGKLMRAKIKIIQKLFIPPSVIAGFIGLACGREALDILPLSTNLGTYAGILIALVFGSLPFSSARKQNGKEIGRMWAYSQAGMLLQWGFGGLLGILVLGKLWPLNDAFGTAMPAGYCGGHGTAAALGQAFMALDRPEMLTLAMTAATVGIVAAVLIGLPIIKYGTRRGQTACLADFKDLSSDMRTGLVSKDNRESLGDATCSTISMDSLTLHLAIIAVTALGGYGISKGVAMAFPKLELPVFSCAFIVGIALKYLFSKTKIDRYICSKTISHMSNAFTDYLVAFGISSIKISIVVQYALPLTILLVAGLLFTAFYVFVAAKMFFRKYWFEKAMFTWGWYTGTMAMGIALFRIVDSKNESRCVDDYALAYLFIAPIEITIITFVPMIFAGGYGLWFSIGCFILGSMVWLSAAGRYRLKTEK